MRIDKPLRSKKASKRIDLSDIREVLKDRRMWAGLGVVVAPTDGSPHWRIETDDSGTAIDILVEVVIQPDQIPITARLTAGMWTVPAIDEEVAILIPAGQVDFQPIIVGILSSNSVPNATGQAPSPTQIVIARGKVYIHDGSGGAEPLVRKSDFDGHTHGPGSFTNGSGAVTGVSAGASAATGTSVLEAK